MNQANVIAAALREAGIEDAIANQIPLTGGCIHDVVHVELASGRSLVAKVASAAQASLLEEERDGLAALHATGTVLVPKAIHVHTDTDACVLLENYLRPCVANKNAWRSFGEAIAALHMHPAGDRYGFPSPNHIGATSQPNDWHDDWIEFNRSCRLGHQLHLARRNSVLSSGEASHIERVIENLEQLIPRNPKPALLHGDLWSGNALPTIDVAGYPRIAIIDPACSIGDGWADIAMMQLFGGFPLACLEAYEANVTDHAQRDSLIAVYQLYHVLNHVNLFGRSYIAHALSLARTLGA